MINLQIKLKSLPSFLIPLISGLAIPFIYYAILMITPEYLWIYIALAVTAIGIFIAILNKNGEKRLFVWYMSLVIVATPLLFFSLFHR